MGDDIDTSTYSKSSTTIDSSHGDLAASPPAEPGQCLLPGVRPLSRPDPAAAGLLPAVRARRRFPVQEGDRVDPEQPTHTSLAHKVLPPTSLHPPLRPRRRLP